MNFLVLISALSIGQSPEWQTWEAYKPTQWSQKLTITDGKPLLRFDRNDVDSHYAGHIKDGKIGPPVTDINPNRIFPWAVPGGLHEVKGWRSELRLHLPEKVKVWKEAIPVAAGAGRTIEGWRWSFPEGSKFADVLSTPKGVFEVRIREKINGKWQSRVEFRDKAAAPSGYAGAGKACADCHSRAGASEQYGVLVRGADGVFSAPVLEWMEVVK